MDKHKAQWTLDFLLQQPIPDRLLYQLISLLPLPTENHCLTKKLLLRRISSSIRSNSITETILETLEMIEELDHRSGIQPSYSMEKAYCAVAVDCTVKCLRGNGDNFRAYYDTVLKIWRDRFGDMEKFGSVGLVSDEMKGLRDELEVALWNVDVRNEFLNKDTRSDAIRCVSVYLAEAEEEIGPSFLDLAVEKVFRERIGSSGLLGEEGRASRDAFVMEERTDADNDVSCRMDVNIAEENPSVIGGQVEETPRAELFHDQIEEGRGGNLHSDQFQERLGRDSIGGLFGDQVEGRMNRDAVVVEERPDGNEDMGFRNLLVDNGCRMDVDACEENTSVARKKRQPVGDQVEETTSGDLFDEEGPGENLQSDQSEQRFGGNVKENVGNILQDRGCRMDVDNTSKENPNVGTKKYIIVSTPEVVRVQEALKSSCVDLHAAVKDPLPDALLMAASISNMRREELEHVHSGENEGAQAVNAREVETRNQNGSVRPSLMHRNNTATTFEWDDDDSIGTSSGQSSRPHLPTPHNGTVSPLSKPEPRKAGRRRRKRRWSSFEEETLIAAVREQGRGNWKRILDCYREIFEDRTVVDLKDKWRNMTK